MQSDSTSNQGVRWSEIFLHIIICICIALGILAGIVWNFAKSITFLAAKGDQGDRRHFSASEPDDNRWSTTWFLSKFQQAIWPADSARTQRLFRGSGTLGGPVWALDFFVVYVTSSLDRRIGELGIVGAHAAILGVVVLELGSWVFGWAVVWGVGSAMAGDGDGRLRFRLGVLEELILLLLLSRERENDSR